MRLKVYRNGLLGAALIAAAGLTAPVLPGGAAWAQGAEGPAPKQIKLTQPIVDHLIAAQKQVRGIEGQGGQDDKPDPKLEAKVQGIVKSAGFASMGDYSDASYTIGIVMQGMDPQTGNYIGAQAALKKQMDEVKADKKMPPKEKKEALDELGEAMKSASAEKPLPGNLELVKANLSKLSEGQGGD